MLYNFTVVTIFFSEIPECSKGKSAIKSHYQVREKETERRREIDFITAIIIKSIIFKAF